MNTNTFANYLLALLIGLLLINYVVCLKSWTKFGSRGIVVSSVILLIINTLAIYGMTKIDVYDDNGAVQNLNDIFANIVAVGVVIAIATVVFIIGGSIIGYQIGGDKRKIGMMLPILSAGIMYGSLAFSMKVLNK